MDCWFLPLFVMEVAPNTELERLRLRLAELEGREEPGSPVSGNPAAEMSLPQRLDILEKMAEGCVAYSRDWRYVYINRKAAEMMQCEPAQILGRNKWELFPEVLGTPAEEALRTAMEGRQATQYEIFDAGIGRWFECQVHPAAEGIAVFFHDITAHKESEAALRESEERFRTIFNLAAAGMAHASIPEGRFTTVNERMCQLTGYSRAELLQRTFLDITHPEDIPGNREIYEELLAGRIPSYCYEKRYLRKDGSRVWVNTTISLIRDASGTPLHSIGVVEDITGRKEAEEALRESEERYRTLFTSMSEGFAVADMVFDAEGRPVDFRFVDVNAAFEKLTGTSRERLIGRTCREAFPMVEPEWIETFGKIVLSGEPVHYEGFSRDVNRWFESVAYRVAPGRFAQVLLDVTQRHQAEEEARGAGARLRLVTDSVPNLISYIDKDFRYQFVNRAYETWFSGKAEELTGRMVPEVLGAEAFREVGPYMRRALQGETTLYEGWAHYRTGPRYIRAVYRPDFGEDRSVRGFAVQVEDLTDRHAAQQALQQSEERFRRAVHESPLPKMIHAEDGEIIHLSRVWTEITGYTPEEIPTITAWTEKAFGEQAGDVQKIFAGMFEITSGAQSGWEFRVRTKDGGERVWLLSTAPLGTLPDGRRLQVTAAVDLTNIRRESEERWRILTQAVPVLVWTAFPDGFVNYCNERWTEFTGLSLGDSCGRGWMRAAHPGDLPRVVPAWETALTTGTEMEAQYRIRRGADGAYRWHLVRAWPLRDGQGAILKWLAASTDIHDEKKMQEELAQSNSALLAVNQELRVANADLEQFAYAAAHDLQEPLRTISVYGQLLERRCQGQLGPEGEEYLSFAITAARRMQELVTDLLAYTQVMAGDQQIERVDCAGILGDLMPGFDYSIRAAGAAVDCGPLPLVAAHSTRVRQLLQNLIANALKYRRPGIPPEIHISAERQGAVWRFAVRDNGVGIEPAYHARIFGVFKRLHGREVPGTGIGLAICKRIVELYGGRIWVESEGPGQGCTFYFTLPAVELSEATPA
jgi:PAS domain S-box-containing protein